MTRPSKPTDRPLCSQMPPVSQERKRRRGSDGDPLLKCGYEARKRAVGSVSGEHDIRRRSVGYVEDDRRAPLSKLTTLSFRQTDHHPTFG